MCADYTPIGEEDLDAFLNAGLDVGGCDLFPEAFPGFMAPIIRQAHDGPRHIEFALACYGMVPHWADIKLARHTYNARTETVASKPSFRNAWKHKHFCIVPAANFFEPCYETGKAVRWRIEQAQGRPLGIGGIWEWKADGPDGLPLLSFSMLTINADKHPLMKRFHKPREEKRMPVILEPQQYHDWLEGALQNDAAAFAPYPADQLVAVADPLPPRSTKNLQFAA
ncbi:SOS response-associated peptidase [Undibacterium arcticum]|uniref:Abasic site processing protein n=1 Tax=Undibacterium arcticum TaxID=1762892 RepID=A0ABV7F2L2_9BURK